jgi:autotransporter-associated beta strand protein
MAESMQDGVPIMRALFLEFPNDPNVANSWNEYMYGPNILVAPVLTAGSTSSSTLGTVSSMPVYLPAGTRWVEYDGESQNPATSQVPVTATVGGQTITLTNVPQGTIPTFAREGAIIPRGDILQDNLTVSDATWKPSLDMDLFPSDKMTSSFDYYTATGSSTQTTQMAGAMVPMQMSIANSILNVNFGNLEVGGAMNIYMNRFMDNLEFNGAAGTVSLNGQTLGANGYTYNSSDDILTVPFTGAVNLDVDLALIPPPAALVWDGHTSNSWDAASLNFTNGTTAFSNGSPVTFGDFAANGTTAVQNTNPIVIASGGVQPSSVTFTNSTNTYRLTDADGSNGIGDNGSTPTSVTISGGGTVIFYSPNSYSGGTSISAGSTLSVASDNALGSVPGTPTTNITLNNGILQVTATTAFNTPTISTNRTISLGASGGTINVTAIGTGTFATNETSVQYRGAIGGTGGLTVTGGSATNTGTAPYLLELAGGGTNSYAGSTTINNAMVASENGFSNGTNILPTTTVLNLINNGWFVLNQGGASQTLAGLNGDSTSFVATDNGVDAVSLTINPAANQTYNFAGTIAAQDVLGKTGGNSVISVLINGPGTQVFSGANSYGNGTTISSGTLRANNSAGSATGSGAVSVGAGATLGGSGSVSGAVTLAAGTSDGSPGVLASGGTITAGGSSTAVGTLTTGNQTWSGQANLVAKVNSITGSGNAAPTAGIDNDLVHTAGSITLSNSNTTAFNVQLLAPAAGVTNFKPGGSTYTFEIASFGSFVAPAGFKYGSSNTTILATDGGATAPAVTNGDAGFFTLDTSSFADASSNFTTTRSSSFALELISDDGAAGQLDVVYFSNAPEPDTTLLALSGAFPMFAGRRRNSKTGHIRMPRN